MSKDDRDKESQGERRRFPLTPLPEDDPLYSNEFVIGQSTLKRPRQDPPPKDRGRGLPHQYAWIDSIEDLEVPSETELQASETRHTSISILDRFIIVLAQIVGFVVGLILGLTVSTFVLFALQIQVFAIGAIASFAAAAVCASFAGRWARRWRGVGK
jgi:hypothetical protein